jgi:acetyl/propionyl-CoA carboxylase alpha subunit
MSRVERPTDLEAALSEGRRIAAAAVGDDAVYLEKLLDRARHVEFQIFGDAQGNAVHLGERECSVQRRHQKIIEETPSPALDAGLRRKMGEAAVAAARAVGYVGAGTIEFLLDAGGRFYFLEMNTRLQVEHPITEETLGVDLVRAQIDVAAGAELPVSWRAGEPVARGHAIEMRLYAEDPVEFLPRSGTILEWIEPSGPGVRVDAGVGRGSRVGVDYDPLLAKLVVHASDRAAAVDRGRRALAEWVVLGVETNLDLLRDVLASDAFRSGDYATDLVPSLPRRERAPVPNAAWIAAALALRGENAGRPPETADPWASLEGWRP